MDLASCGTGKWGLKLLKAGYSVTFTDLSNNMLQEVRKKLEEWSAQPDLASKAARATVSPGGCRRSHDAFPEGGFELVHRHGRRRLDLLRSRPMPVAGLHRLLKPGGVFVFTVDNYLAAIDHYIEAGNLRDLASFIKTGRTQWLTKKQDEKFQVHIFHPRRNRRSDEKEWLRTDFANRKDGDTGTAESEALRGGRRGGAPGGAGNHAAKGARRRWAGQPFADRRASDMKRITKKNRPFLA